MAKKSSPAVPAPAATATPSSPAPASTPAAQPESAKDKRKKLKGRAAVIEAFNVLLFNLSIPPEAEAQIRTLLAQAEKAE